MLHLIHQGVLSFNNYLPFRCKRKGNTLHFGKPIFWLSLETGCRSQSGLFTHATLNRVGFLLDKYGLKTIDTSPNGIFARLLKLFPKSLKPKAVEAEFKLTEAGLPAITPKIEFSPADAAQPANFFGVDYITGLQLLESSLKESNITIWVALDRLDEAFLGYPSVEIPALRALLRTYLDLQTITNIKLKLFLRKDLFRKVIAGGFVNLTHINDQKIEIVWEEEDMKNLLIARVKDSPLVVEHLDLKHATNDEAFGRLFPQKISQGKKQSTTWNWMISRIRDGNGVIAPRNLIDLVEKAREAQLRVEVISSREFNSGRAIIEADSVKKAHRALSESRVQDTLMAESAELTPLIEKFRDNKAEQNVQSLCELFGIPEDAVRSTVKPLVEIGFLEEKGNSYKVPMLYREGLSITQGKASLTNGH